MTVQGFRKPGGVQFFTIPVNGGTPRQISNIKPEKRAGQGVWLGNDKIVFLQILMKTQIIIPIILKYMFLV